MTLFKFILEVHFSVYLVICVCTDRNTIPIILKFQGVVFNDIWALDKKLIFSPEHMEILEDRQHSIQGSNSLKGSEWGFKILYLGDICFSERQALTKGMQKEGKMTEPSWCRYLFLVCGWCHAFQFCKFSFLLCNPLCIFLAEYFLSFSLVLMLGAEFSFANGLCR